MATVADLKPTPAAPHAFGCTHCVTASRARVAAEHVAGRLLGLEQQLDRRTPTWDRTA